GATHHSERHCDREPRAGLRTPRELPPGPSPGVLVQDAGDAGRAGAPVRRGDPPLLLCGASLQRSVAPAGRTAGLRVGLGRATARPVPVPAPRVRLDRGGTFGAAVVRGWHYPLTDRQGPPTVSRPPWSRRGSRRPDGPGGRAGGDRRPRGRAAVP